MSSPRFLLDANCFIEPHNTFYPFCYAPAFWDALIHGHRAGMVFTLDEVEKEITKQVNEVKKWIEHENFPRSFILPTTVETVRKYAEIQKWANEQTNFSPAAKKAFADGLR